MAKFTLRLTTGLTLVTLLLLLVAGCGGGNLNDAFGADRDELAAKRAQWKGKGVRNYRFTATYDKDSVMKAQFEAEVQNGELTAFRVLNPERFPESEKKEIRARYSTVERLFDAAETRIAAQPDGLVDLEYDETLGYPKQIAIKTPAPEQYVADASRFVVDSFTITE